MADPGEFTASAHLSISALSRLTGLDRATISKRITAAGIHPVATKQNAKLYRVGDVLPVIYDDGPSAGQLPANAEALQNRKLAVQVAQLELDYGLAAGQLIHKDVVHKQAHATGRLVRDRLLKMPDKLSSELAATGDAHAVRQRLDGEFREILAELAGAVGDADGTDD